MYHRRTNLGMSSNDCAVCVPSNVPPPNPTTPSKTTRIAENMNGKLHGKKFIRWKSHIFEKKFSLRKFLQEQDKEDLAILIIQLICICVLMGCAIGLFVKWVIFDNYSSFGVDTGGATYPWWGGINPFNLIGGPRGRMGRGRHPYPKVPLPPSKIYTIPDSMSHIGDKTDEYAQLRKDIDQIELPPVQHAYEFAPLPMDVTHSDQVPYDIYNCPDEPPQGYPFDWLLVDMLKKWPSDDPEPREYIHQGLCVFDYEKDYEKAITYRNLELPFVVKNDPQAKAAAQRWNTPGFMEGMLRDVRHRAEYSENNHFLYWNAPPSARKNKNDQVREQRRKLKGGNGFNGGMNRKRAQKQRNFFRNMYVPEGWQEPTQMLRIPYTEWLRHANVTDDKLGPDQPHWYFRLIGCGEEGPEGQCDGGSSEYLFDELPFFQPKKSLYVVEPEKQKGIHCRFGMKGVIAENHFDGSRNAIVVLGGERRYVLAHPDQCDKLALYPKGHPSARHSEVDWSDPDLDEFPEFGLAKGNEVVMQAGDIMYLPTNWFHYIISLSLNFQCNTRSGITQEYMPPIQQCGF